MADADTDWALGLLEHLVGLESPSGDLERLAVLGDELAALLTDAGADVTVAPGGHLDATVRDGGDPHVLVLAHYDTVWPAGRLLESPFRVHDGLATGPGAFDMKAGLVALVWALHHLADSPAAALRIVVTADEEVGSPSGAQLVAEAARGAAAVFALEPPLPAGRLKVGRRGVARVALSVTGREAHAGLDAANGVAATEELADQLVALRAALPDTPTRSLNVGRICGGTRANVVAGHAQAELGLRFSTDEDERALLDALGGLTPNRAGARLTTDTLSRRPAWEPTTSLGLAAHVMALAEDLGEKIDHGVSGGGGDANLTGSLGIPTVDGLGPRGHGAHSPDEAVEIASILPRARLLLRLLSEPLP